jgi:hypothetical protein
MRPGGRLGVRISIDRPIVVKELLEAYRNRNDRRRAGEDLKAELGRRPWG